MRPKKLFMLSQTCRPVEGRNGWASSCRSLHIGHRSCRSRGCSREFGSVWVAAFLRMYLMATFVIHVSVIRANPFAQLAKSPAMHVLATGYVFTAITVIPYSLTFPGVFAPESVIGDLQSRPVDVWLPMFVIGYALLKDKTPTEQTRRLTVPAAIVLSLVSTAAAVVFAAVVLCILVEGHSPIIILDICHFSPLFPYFVGVPVVAASLRALAVLWIS